MSADAPTSNGVSAIHTDDPCHWLFGLARRCHERLLLQYATPTDVRHTRRLLHDTDVCYKQLHWLWHHAVQAPDDMSSSIMRTIDSNPPSSPLAALHTLVESMLVARCVSSDSASSASCDSALNSCAVFCQQYDFEQRRMAKYQAEQAKNQRDIDEASVEPADEPTSDDEERAEDEESPAGSPIINSPSPQPIAPCHEDGSCHLQQPTTVVDPSHLHTGTPAFSPYLLTLHSIFLLRIVFLYVFNDAMLIDADGGSTSVESRAVRPLPLLSRLCGSFGQWPSSLHAAVHSFGDNLQWCCYVHMIQGLRGSGPGSDAVPNAYALDGRVWKRITALMKAKQKQHLVRSDTLKQQYQTMMSASPATYLLRSAASPSSYVDPRVPSILYVLGDSHTLTLHSQWLLLPHERQQRMSWLQMRSYVVLGLKAWHVGQLSSSAVAATSPLHQSSMFRRYAALIPPGARVLLVAGEIDCRADEGITAAVAKGKYVSTAEGVRDTVRRFLDGARHLARERSWAAVFVHPVCAPYLRGHKVRLAKKGWKDLKEESRREQDATAVTKGVDQSAASESEPPSLLTRVHARALLIRDFNVELKQQIEQLQLSTTQHASPDPSCSSATPAGPSCQFHYLDFYPDLCSSPPASATLASPPLLRAEYTLEGLHLNTKYIPLIERELEQAMDVDH
jgi:hypothetical protein